MHTKINMIQRTVMYDAQLAHTKFELSQKLHLDMYTYCN